MTEANTINNFNFGFSTHKSDILIHLSQWQYWWWFWFSVFWCLYFFIIIRVSHKRVLQFNPIINTSIRGHGKWGDFLVALIPLSWCGNILINSNFILRMIEWQNESSLFTVRIQGKQWYWVYKFDATASYNILAAPKNIGNNRWYISVPGESYCVDNYYQAINLGTQLEYKKLYFKLLKDDNLTQNKINNLNKSINIIKFSTNLDANLVNPANFFRFLITEKSTMSYNKFLFFSNNLDIYYKNLVNCNNLINLIPQKNSGNYSINQIDDSSNFAANLLDVSKVKPFKIIKGTLNKHNIDLIHHNYSLNKNILYVGKFNKEPGSLESKPDDSELVWGFKQKKYKRLQKFKFSEALEYDSKTLLPLKASTKNPFILKSNLVSKLVNEDSIDKSFNYQKSIKYNRQRQELVPVNLARRLLRTKRTLVLPAHVNITLITNSYDVVHSWFIPGLGIKIDCVPGRSTHHTFYIDNIGFYYGQCAEICGRYHHHMPIRICALSFDQFLVWWQKKGLKRLHRFTNNSKLTNSDFIKFKYTW